MGRRVFYSFRYRDDCQRAAQVRSIGAIEGNVPASDNDWEAVKSGGDPAIERWIKGQMLGRSCTVVLVGANTANQKWVNYEIVESWNSRMGLVAIRIHGLKNLKGETSFMGGNPFDHISVGDRRLSSIARCYDPGGYSSQERYNWIKTHLSNAVEEAIRIRNES